MIVLESRQKAGRTILVDNVPFVFDFSGKCMVPERHAVQCIEVLKKPGVKVVSSGRSGLIREMLAIGQGQETLEETSVLEEVKQITNADKRKALEKARKEKALKEERTVKKAAEIKKPRVKKASRKKKKSSRKKSAE